MSSYFLTNGLSHSSFGELAQVYISIIGSVVVFLTRFRTMMECESYRQTHIMYV